MGEVTMADRAGWLIYGANGYTGRLVAVEARRRGLRPVLAGRHASPIETLAAKLNLPARVFDLGDARAVAAALADMVVVANCAGPFSATSAQMIDACLMSRTHRDRDFSASRHCCCRNVHGRRRHAAVDFPRVFPA